MKRSIVAIAALLVGMAAGPAPAEEPPKVTFPDFEGRVIEDRVRHLDPATLFEYINGKADGYLDYAFRELEGIDYRLPGGGEISVDVYRHATVNDAFGIFSSERPGDAVEAGFGAAGYAEPGHLNFFKDVYYVKIAGRDLGEEDAEVLARAADRMAEALPGEAAVPPAVSCFPPENLVPNSVRYVAQGFLGHSFLHSAFVAEYGAGEGTYRAFVLEGADDADRDGMLAGYLDLVGRKGGEAVVVDGVHRFYDPYRTFEGVLNLRPAGRRLLGVFLEDPAAAARCLDALERNLAGLE